VFCLSLGDWLDEEVPLNGWRFTLFDLEVRKSLLQLLTKRPQNWRERIVAALMFASNHDRFDISFIRATELDTGAPDGSRSACARKHLDRSKRGADQKRRWQYRPTFIS